MEQEQQMLVQEEDEQDDFDNFGKNQQYAPPQYIGSQADFVQEESEEEDLVL